MTMMMTQNGDDNYDDNENDYDNDDDYDADAKSATLKELPKTEKL